MGKLRFGGKKKAAAAAAAAAASNAAGTGSNSGANGSLSEEERQRRADEEKVRIPSVFFLFLSLFSIPSSLFLPTVLLVPSVGPAGGLLNVWETEEDTDETFSFFLTFVFVVS